ncbi:energy-coupling factor transporter transmembrane component T family protein [Halegenticoccus soli]|uniref:energy-coupling factor transporter transmembrane component T family protein n=1 Tax=Halegenticoccus soli TaxID=1985678 RepID=UPI0018ECFFE9|nr:energy-coupling factor transporter transmembrane component T [Halegenticoccus soli]
MNTSIYKPGESVVHRLNPVTKLVVAAAVSILVFLVPNYRFALAISLALFVGVAVAGVSGIVLRLVGLAMVPFGALLLVIQGILNPANHDAPFFVVGPVTLWEAGVAETLLIFFRVLVLVLSFLLMATTSQPQKLRIALMEKGVPPQLAYVFIASLQIIPQIQARAEAIADAQQARGLDREADIRTRSKSLVALLAPLLIGTLIVANTRALALNARGFNRRTPRVFLYEVADPAGERALRWASVLAVIGAGAWRVFRWL